MECFKTFESDGMTSNKVDDLLTLVQQFAELDESFVDQQCAHQEFMLTGDQPECEACIPPSMPDEYLWYEVPTPCEEHSPEHMAEWMIGRLTKRLAEYIKIGDIHKMKIYVERRQIMNAVIRVCQREPTQ